MFFNSHTLHKPFLFLFSCFFCFIVSAQLFTEKKYPQGYFIYPVAAQKIALAANFGELRPDHFHMGLDCKTDHRENVVVYAAAKGYIAKIKIEPFGFGRAIYINHPNGFTTIYAHLNEFYPELEQYVKERQYKLESWEIFINIPANLFPVNQKQFIALSGNTGGSQGPHTHFEIRETKSDKNVNPLLFGFPIVDKVPPSVISVAIFNRQFSTYTQKPGIIPVIKKNGNYTTAIKLLTTTNECVSFGIVAFDRLDNSFNHNGIFEAILYDDEKPISGFRLNDISYDDTRYVNAHIDYSTKMAGGPFIQHLSKLPGNMQDVYNTISGNGIISLMDNAVHHIKIIVKDAYLNKSTILFDLHHSASGNFPANIDHANDVVFEPASRNIFDNNEVQVITDEKAVYDPINFLYSAKPSLNTNAVSNMYSISTALIPLHTLAKIKLRTSMSVIGTDQDRILMQWSWKDKSEVIKATKAGEMYVAEFRKFGNFQLLLDKEFPVIIPSFTRSEISILVKDNNILVKNFRGELDGKWLRFTNDKARAFIYKFDEMCSPGIHNLNISVQDEAGNTTTENFKFTR